MNMLEVNTTARFRRDLRLCNKRGYDLNLLQEVIDTLRIPQSLPERNRDHALNGKHSGFRECHVLPDWLLTYRIEGNILYLDRTGTHADLFGM